MIGDSHTQKCVGIGENAFMTIGRTKIKITLNGSLVYYFDVWIGDQVCQEAILGMDFMVPLGIRLDLADRMLCFPDEVRISLAGRRPSYRSTIQAVNITDQHVVIPVSGSTEVRIGTIAPKSKLWVRRDVAWVPTVTTGLGRSNHMQLTNISERKVILGHGLPLGLLMINDMVPRSPGYVSVGSRRYQDWQTLAFKATTDQTDAMIQYDSEPHVIRLVYRTTTQTLARSKEKKENDEKAIKRVNDEDYRRS